MDDPDGSGPVAGDPATVAETLQRHLEDESDTERVGALQPVVEAVAGWRDADSVAPDDWLAALKATPDVLYLRTDEGVLRHRPTVTGDRVDPEPFRFAADPERSEGEGGAASGRAEPLSHAEASSLLEGAAVTIGIVADLSLDVRARFLTEE
ncbi:hypothetical protein C474_20681 [Halogeometricum pallidum JCM 14848]|uniref:Uncharacterized protein n=1 Tax=Halogeometricum pallidum JCM 14848 TaxID=1227487 RepID=M0CSB4_HALPD|nr:hypothetical protein [Halogeometricum pallidum]ELZ26155.1 hypothetical protein C474_20681 [Halogeometricum pallidum JCM 14848]